MRAMFAVLVLPIICAAGLRCQEHDGSAPGAQLESTVDTPLVPPGRTVANASRNAAALETLRAHWDSEIITGTMVDEVKKVLDERAPEDIEPLLERIELLDRSGMIYAPDFALWWEERGRNELGGDLFWRRDLLREAIDVAFEQHDELEALRLIDQAAETGDPVAKMWQAFAQAESGGRHDPSALGEVMARVEKARALADQGDPEAALLLGTIAAEGDTDITRATPEDVVRWLQTAADAGYRYATQMLVDYAGMESLQAGVNEAPASTRANADARAAELRASSSNNLKQLALVGKMFANEASGEMWPPLSAERGQLAMDAAAIYPEYLVDPNIYISPAYPGPDPLMETAQSDPRSVIRDHSYWYLGYAINNEKQGLELVKLLRETVEAGEPFPDAFDTPQLDPKKLYRLREGIERFFITDIHDPLAPSTAQAEIPVMIERPGMHEDGANVLYLDGHVEFHRFPGEFPMSPAFIEALKSLDELKPMSTGGAFVPRGHPQSSDP